MIGAAVSLLLAHNKNIEIQESDIEPGIHYVIAANHQTYLDPWMVLSRIPTSIWKKIGTPRALVANRFFEYPILGSYLRSMGSFPAKAHRTDPYGLEYANRLLERGQSIVIFPEGRITLHRQNPARHGVMVLAQRPNVRIIPMHFEWARPRSKAKFDLGVGKPFDGSKMTAQEILDRIYSVPVK
jgi:1-acyl-sn-glycerol-3-phosphate acyltransferase